MKKLLAPALFLFTFSLHAQFSAYDAFDENSNDWLVRNDDSATVRIDHGKLDTEVKYDGDFLDAKGASIDSSREFRAELSMDYYSGNTNVPYGICVGASDVNNYHLFYITAEGQYGFKTLVNNTWKEIIPATSCPMIHVKGSNWLRVNVVKEGGVLKMHLCINELLVKTMDYIMPYGSYYGVYVGGRQRILFDDFIVYQRGKTQDEFEPEDLTYSLKCRNGELYYENRFDRWACCLQYGSRADEDSGVSRFWYTDMRAGDYSIIVVPMLSKGSVTFAKAAEQDMSDYLAEGDSIIRVRKEETKMVALGNEPKVYQLGQVYTASDLKNNLYIRRYYVEHPFGENEGIVLQFIVPENSPCIADLDALARQIIATLEMQ